MNQACLLKLNWKYYSGSNAFWCGVLRGKYEEGRAQGLFEVRSTDSDLWKTLAALTPKLEEHSVWSIRDGSVVDAWRHAWIEVGLHIEQLVDVPPQLQGFKVNELIDRDGGWNWLMLQDWLPSDIQHKIAYIPPPRMENGQDERCSVGDNIKGFSINLMYQNLSGIHKEDADPKWSKTWKLLVPERVKTFMWLVLHNRLMTNDFKFRIGLGHAMCPYCGNIEETVIHVLRDCYVAMDLWNKALPLNSRAIFYMVDAQSWIENNLFNTDVKNNNTSWCNYWAMACYWLWTWRNKELHDENFFRPAMAAQHVWKKVEEYNIAVHNSSEIMSKDKVLRLISWKHPKPLFVSLNTDGACKAQQISGCGGLIRGDQGEWIGGFAKCVGRCSALIAELWGVLEGLRYVRSLGINKIELNIDSEAVVKSIKTGRSQSAAESALTDQILKMLALDWEVEVRHTYREANKCADALANFGCNSSFDLKFFDSCPVFIRELFDADNLGISTPRLVTV